MPFPIGPHGPKKMIFRTASMPVSPEPSILLEAVDRPRIRIPFVEVLDFRCYFGGA